MSTWVPMNKNISKVSELFGDELIKVALHPKKHPIVFGMLHE
jgi:hypothetical protein